MRFNSAIRAKIICDHAIYAIWLAGTGSIRASESKTEVLDIKDSVSEISNGFSPEVSGCLRPNGHKNPELREWEKNILVHLNNVNLVERDDRKTLYVKFKLFKRDIYRLIGAVYYDPAGLARSI